MFDHVYADEIAACHRDRAAAYAIRAEKTTLAAQYALDVHAATSEQYRLAFAPKMTSDRTRAVLDLDLDSHRPGSTLTYGVLVTGVSRAHVDEARLADSLSELDSIAWAGTPTPHAPDRYHPGTREKTPARYRPRLRLYAILATESLDGVEETVEVGLRAAQVRRRRDAATRFAEFREHPEFDGIVDALTDYIGRCVPWPQETERRFWSVTTLPSTGGTREWRRLAVVNINNVEALVIGEAREHDGPWVTTGFVNLSADTRVPGRWRHSRWTHSYRTTGEVVSLEFVGLAEHADFLTDDAVLQGARRFALGLMKKGNGMQGRWHDYNLADEIFLRLDENFG